MASKHRNLFYKKKKQEMREIGSFCAVKSDVSGAKSCPMFHGISAKSLQHAVMHSQGGDRAGSGLSDRERSLEEAVMGLLAKKGSKDNLVDSDHQLMTKQKSASSGQRSKSSVSVRKDYQDEDSDYQHISEATTVHTTRAHVHKSATPPAVYPHSDTEDSVFYPDTPSSGRRSSTDLMDRRKTLVVVIGHGKGGGGGAKGGKGRLMQKQRSWETFPPKRRNHHQSTSSMQASSKFCRDPDSFRGAFDLNGLKKADSFEGHEEAVRTLVAAVQETRTLRKTKPSQAPAGSDPGSA